MDKRPYLAQFGRLLILFAIFSTSCISQETLNKHYLSPIPIDGLKAYWSDGYSSYHATYLYDADKDKVIDVISKNLASLDFVQKAALKKVSKFDSGIDTYQKSSRVETNNCNDLVYECYHVSFTPPPVPRQPISGGWIWIPRKFYIRFEIGYARKNPQKTFVYMNREWDYWTTGHFPDTEIPFLELPTFEKFILESDVQWLKNIGDQLGVYYRNTGDQMPFSEAIYDELIHRY